MKIDLRWMVIAPLFALTSACGTTVAPGQMDAGDDSDAGVDADTFDAAVDASAHTGPFAQTTYVKASNTAAAQEFGQAIAVSADGNTLVVGAPTESSASLGINGDQSGNAAHYSGAAYVFRRVAGSWSQQAYLKASNAIAGARFGGAFALSSDGNTLAVGSTNEASIAAGINGNQADTSRPGAGAVYIFRYSAGTWTQGAYVKASNPQLADFGTSVGLSGDGVVLAVGANLESSGATGINGDQTNTTAAQSGAVYLFRRAGAGNTWAQEAYVKASNTAAMQTFGTAVALSQDGTTLSVGAIGEASAATGVDGDQTDSSAPNSGAVYVFRNSAGSWAQQAYLKASAVHAGEQFGSSLALAMDGNTLAVGAPGDASNAVGINGDAADTSSDASGATFVFRYVGGAWAQDAYVKASNSQPSEYFGNAVALSTDGNRLFVGAYADAHTPSGTIVFGTDLNSGAAYVFARGTSSWRQTDFLKVSNETESQYVGTSLGVSGSGNTLIVGAPGEGSNATGINGNQSDTSLAGTGGYGAGAAYIFEN